MEFFQPRIIYLGFEFDHMGYRPKPEVMPKIRDYPAPVDKKGIQKFLGIINFYRDHIPGVAEVGHPIYELLRKYHRFKWEPEHQEAFESLKKLVAANITLSPIQQDLPFELYTDASNNAIGAALLQGGKVVNFFSRHLQPTQQRYSTTMRESYAMVESILNYMVYFLLIINPLWNGSS